MKRSTWISIATLVGIELALFSTNYSPGTWLMGWDNIAPEFNFKVNILRNIFGVWQEYRGLGLYDGMSHIANLPHTLLLWILSLVIPTDLLRYIFIFGTHLAGGIGMYILTGSLPGSIFYLLNLTTIQIFHTPFEAFSVHFAALPWLAWSLMAYLHGPSKKTYARFLFISLMTTPQFFVPTMMIPIAILLAALSIRHRPWKHVSTAAIGFMLINAFWLLPYLYGLPHTAPVIAQAKINQMSSGEAFLRNQAFGNISDVLMLRGFPLDFEDYTNESTPKFLMEAWRSLAISPQYFFIGGIFLALAGLGMRKKSAFTIPLVVSLFILASNTPVIMEITSYVRTHVPILGEALRFPFTKFGLLYVFCLTIFIAHGLKRFPGAIIGVIIILMGITSYPAFLGQFINPNMHVQMPQEYSDFYAFMQTQSPSSRIVSLPQSDYWSWKLYRFGYRGSGFTWFGLPQPLLDRAFDPWSAQNENYYWELSAPLYAKDALRLGSVFAKYGVKYILIDENVVTSGNSRSLFTDESKILLSQIPGITQVARFGNLTLYERTNADYDHFVKLTTSLPSVNSYKWTDNDIAYQELGDYVEGKEIQYPFRNLFTKRSIAERDFEPKSLIKSDALVYDSTASGELNPQAVNPCGLQDAGTIHASFDEFLRLESINNRACLSFGLPNLPHKDAYIIAIESRHVSGRPLLISIINQTAKHLELENYLSVDPDWNTQYFILPPLSPDGLGYNPYISNDSIGDQKTVNDIKSLRIYTFPYADLVHIDTGGELPPQGRALNSQLSVSHPNPAFYKVILDGSWVEPGMTNTLILSQSHDPGWLAYDATNKRFLKNHVLVNNWSNGWILPTNKVTNNQLTVYLFFWPQLLQFLGFALLPFPFLFIFRKKG